MASRSPVTMKSIAEALGVSVTTVARALKGGERISAATTSKVNQVADQLGYVRNLDAVKLRTGQTFVVMTFLRFSSEEEIGDAGSVGLLNGIHQRLAGSEYAVRAAPVTMEESGLGAIEKAVRGRNADGIILDHTTPDDERVNYLVQAGVPFVSFGQTNLSSEHAFFDLDNELAAYQGTKAMLEQGFQRVALLDADKRYSFVSQRLQGYRRALEEAGIDVNPSLVRHIPLQPTVANKVARELLQAGATAFVCVNELVFFGARAGVGAALGVDSSRVGYSFRSGTNIGAYVGSPHSAVYYSRMAAGWHLADLLMQRMQGAPLSACQKIGCTELRHY